MARKAPTSERNPDAERAVDNIESGNPPKLPPVRLVGDAIEPYAVPYAVMSLIMSIGELEGGDKTLLSFIDMKLAGIGEEEEEEPELLLSEVVTFENAAFVLSSLLRDYSLACEHLTDLARGRLRPEPARVASAREYMHKARDSVQACIDRLDALTEMA